MHNAGYCWLLPVSYMESTEMNWLEKLGDLMFVGGLGGVIASALPQHVQRRVRERLGDLNPYNVISGNHDLMRATRLAWVRAAFDVLDAAKETIDAGYSQFDRSDTLRFEKHARGVLMKIRSDTLDRRANPGNSPIDHHLEMIIQGTSEFVAPGGNSLLDQSLTDDFDRTLAALTAWPVRKLPPIFAQIAQTGLPTIDQSTQRKFSELVFAAFAELLKSPDQYPEAKSAFTIATGNAARALSKEILVRIKTIDEKFDDYIASNDALEIFKTGAATLPPLLEGQERIEVLALIIRSDVRVQKNNTPTKVKSIKQVFVSHSRNDNEIAFAVENELRKYNINVWNDSLITPGSEWASLVNNALDSSDTIIAILNKHSYSSPWVRLELEHALFNEKYKGRFFPVLISNNQSDLTRLPWILSKIEHLLLSPDEPQNILGEKIVKEFLEYLNQGHGSHGS